MHRSSNNICLLLGLLVVIITCLQIGSNASALNRIKRGTLSEEADNIIRQGSTVDVNNVGQLIELVEKNNADECMTRVICELTQNGRSHGDAGVKFAQSLLKFRQSKHAKVKKYQDAMSYGAKAKNAEQCKTKYPKCTETTHEIITVSNKILSRSS